MSILVRYVAWLVQVRHLPKQEPAGTTSADPDLAEAALASGQTVLPATEVERPRAEVHATNTKP